MHKRILALGITGTNKVRALEKCAADLEKLGHRTSDIRVVDFEKEFLSKNHNFRTLPAFLAKPAQEQADIWDESWERCQKSFDGRTTLLSLHGTIVRDDFGVRIAMNTERVANDFEPTVIVTLIDDLHLCWGRTEKRANKEVSRGRPTFEQLLMARRVEAILGDQVARYARTRDRNPRHVMIAVQHPVQSLTNLVVSEHAKVIYLSFPISAPVELSSHADVAKRTEGDKVIQAINAFHHLANACQQKHKNLVMISPLAIDELPFANAARQNSHSESFSFDLTKYRWSVNALWSNAELLSDLVLDNIMTIAPAKSAEVVAGLLETDIGWRDFRLVEQADYLACYSPVVPRTDGSWKISRGVHAELKKAVARNIPSYVYQEPTFDPQGVWAKTIPLPGSMGNDPEHLIIENKTSLDALFDSIANRS